MQRPPSFEVVSDVTRSRWPFQSLLCLSSSSWRWRCSTGTTTRPWLGDWPRSNPSFSIIGEKDRRRPPILIRTLNNWEKLCLRKREWQRMKLFSSIRQTLRVGQKKFTFSVFSINFQLSTRLDIVNVISLLFSLKKIFRTWKPKNKCGMCVCHVRQLSLEKYFFDSLDNCSFIHKFL